MTSLLTPRADALVPVHDMSTEALRREYISLKSTGYSLSVEESHLKNKIEVLREESVRAELNAEVKEEQVSNQLFRRLDGAEKEVQRCRALLKEEEGEAEALTSRIKEMRNQQNEVENALEERQEYLLMNLQRKLLETARKKTEVEQELMLERQRYLDVLVTRLDMLRGRTNDDASSAAAGPQPTPLASGSADAAASSSAEKHVDAAASILSRSAVLSPAPPLQSGDSSLVVEAHSVPSADNGGSASDASPLQATAGAAGAAASGSTRAATPGLRSPPSTKLQPQALATTPHALSITPTSRPSLSGTPRSGDLTPVSSHSSQTHHAVVALERKLNQLLLDQAAAMQRTSATEKQCAELGAKLRSVQEATFLDRARASKMKDELKEARARLVEVDNPAVSGSSMFADASFDDSITGGVSSRSFDPSVSLTMGTLSLRERTRELLSSIPPTSMN